MNQDQDRSQVSHVSREFSRLINAAAINKDFCGLLLTNPAAALKTGHNREMFCLTPEEEKFILSVRASTLADFASQVDQWAYRAEGEIEPPIVTVPAGANPNEDAWKME